MKKHQYQFATIALYGPDDKVTTKIVVGIFKNSSDDPLLRRWVGVNILKDPETQRQIHVFLKEYSIRSVTATDGNIGCPHEEELDFPMFSPSHIMKDLVLPVGAQNRPMVHQIQID